MGGPCFPQVDSLNERMNQTLKAMPEKYAGQDPKHWETGLSFLLLAHREISQASMRFNPFELFYGDSFKRF